MPGHRTRVSPGVVLERTDRTPGESLGGKVFGARHVFRVFTGAHYLWGYIGYNESKHDWLRERTLTWENNINTIRETAGKYLQDSKAAVVLAISLR